MLEVSATCQPDSPLNTTLSSFFTISTVLSRMAIETTARPLASALPLWDRGPRPTTTGAAANAPTGRRSGQRRRRYHRRAGPGAATAGATGHVGDRLPAVAGGPSFFAAARTSSFGAAFAMSSEPASMSRSGVLFSWDWGR